MNSAIMPMPQDRHSHFKAQNLSGADAMSWNRLLNVSKAVQLDKHDTK